MIVNPGRLRGSLGSFARARNIINGVFSGGRDGFIFVPFLTSLNQLSTGITPVATVADPVGLMLDQHLGLVASTKGAYLRVAGSHLDSPDRASNRPTGDFTWIGKFAADDFTPAALQMLYLDGSNASPASQNIAPYIESDGTIRLNRPTGATQRTYISTVALSTVVSNYSSVVVKINWQQNVAGVSQTTFYYSLDDGATFTQLGAVVTNANTGAGNSNTTGIHIGSSQIGASTFLGKIYYTKLYDAAGVLVTNYNSTDYPGSGTTVTSSTTSEVYTLQGSAYIAPDGNHAIQATAGSRPTYNKRVNLLLNSNVLSAWAVNGTPNATQNAIGIDGVANTAWTLTDNSTGSPVEGISLTLSLVAGVRTTYSLYIKKTIGVQTNFPSVFYLNSAVTHGAGVNIDTTNGTVLAWTSRSAVTIVTSSANIVSHNSDYWRVALTFIPQTTEATSFIAFYPAFRNVFDASGDGIAAAQGSAVIQNLQAEYGTTATRYQNITTATAFDEVGFPAYINSDGVDDSLVSATGGDGAAGMYYNEVFRPLAAAGAIRTLYSDIGANTGYQVRIDAAGKASFSAGDGAAYTTVTSVLAVNPGDINWFEAYDDGTNLYISLNGATPVSAARPVVVAGTVSYTLGKDNGAATSFRSGNSFASIRYKNTAGTAAERSAALTYSKSFVGL